MFHDKTTAKLLLSSPTNNTSPTPVTPEVIEQSVFSAEGKADTSSAIRSFFDGYYDAINDNDHRYDFSNDLGDLPDSYTSGFNIAHQHMRQLDAAEQEVSDV
jgi:hypothetical protein